MTKKTGDFFAEENLSFVESYAHVTPLHITGP